MLSPRSATDLQHNLPRSTSHSATSLHHTLQQIYITLCNWFTNSATGLRYSLQQLYTTLCNRSTPHSVTGLHHTVISLHQCNSFTVHPSIRIQYCLQKVYTAPWNMFTLHYLPGLQQSNYCTLRNSEESL